MPHDLWQWAAEPEKTQAWLRRHGPWDWIVCGFSCVDMSVANARGQGLAGSNSAVYFAAREVKRMVEEVMAAGWPTERLTDFTFECTNFSRKHKKDWRLVSRELRVEAAIVDAARIAEARRERAFWSSFELLALQQRRASPAAIMESRARTPLVKWTAKRV